MTYVNLYLESKEKKLKTYQIDELVTNIDRARMLIFKKVNNFYLNSKYKIELINRTEDEKIFSQIDVIFEKNLELNREFVLKELLI
jgi:hypothetical protein